MANYPYFDQESIIGPNDLLIAAIARACDATLQPIYDEINSKYGLNEKQERNRDTLWLAHLKIS